MQRVLIGNSSYFIVVAGSDFPITEMELNEECLGSEPREKCGLTRYAFQWLFRRIPGIREADAAIEALNQRPRASFSLAGFEVTLIGRFWVTPEEWFARLTLGTGTV